jgi:phytoene dehydrogenase-like protein
MMIGNVEEIPPAELTLLDLTPRQIVAVAGNSLPPGYARRLSRFRYGAGVFKADYALDRPIPWRAAECLQAGTVHLGGALEEIEAAEAAVARGEHPESPFVILAQQSLFDRTRAPGSAQTAWAYCHVPNGSTVDMTDRIEAQIERYAPGFRSSILARSIRNCADMERYNPNYIGGDINGGMQDWRQLFRDPSPASALHDSRQGALHLLVLHSPGWRCAWHVRVPRSPFGHERDKGITTEPIRRDSMITSLGSVPPFVGDRAACQWVTT